jgi:hypothetical protein
LLSISVLAGVNWSVEKTSSTFFVQSRTTGLKGEEKEKAGKAKKGGIATSFSFTFTGARCVGAPDIDDEKRRETFSLGKSPY